MRWVCVCTRSQRERERESTRVSQCRREFFSSTGCFNFSLLRFFFSLIPSNQKPKNRKKEQQQQQNRTEAIGDTRGWNVKRRHIAVTEWPWEFILEIHIYKWKRRWQCRWWLFGVLFGCCCCCCCVAYVFLWKNWYSIFLCQFFFSCVCKWCCCLLANALIHNLVYFLYWKWTRPKHSPFIASSSSASSSSHASSEPRGKYKMCDRWAIEGKVNVVCSFFLVWKKL